MQRPKPVMLLILDGWGYNPSDQFNAVAIADTPILDQLQENYPHTLLGTSGKNVGLPEGIMGNSEVGHLNIGAGRIVYQDLLRIDLSIENGSFFENKALSEAMTTALSNKRALHLMGLVSDGGVHSQLTHLFALLGMARQKGLSKVFVHAILDGRDTAPDGGRQYVAQLQDYLKKNGTGKIATLCGRYYAMDRDTRWDRTEQAYRLYTEAEGHSHTDPEKAVKAAYEAGQSDEFVKPIVITDSEGQALARVEDGDVIVFFNFRADRARQITRAFTQDSFDGFKRRIYPKLGAYVCMTEYDENFDLPAAFPPEHLEAILGEVLSTGGYTQLRIAETEKYAHVTYFFNGGEEKSFANEERCLIPSPRDVPTYDHKPDMSALAVTDEVLKRIDSDRYDFIVLNFANMDMVGHTGNIDAAVKACETVDRCVGRIVEAVKAKEGVLLITADHGNAETMRAPNGSMHTAHTTNPVRLILVDDNRRQARLKEGILGDIAPTVLQIMGIAQPPQMTGRSLIVS